MDQLRKAIDATGAFYGFDPVGGGNTVDSCFKAMEQVAVSKMSEYSRYGSNQQKQMFIYGRLDFGPTILTPSYGFGWTLSGWLLTPFLQKIDKDTRDRLSERVADEITTTFASSYGMALSLADAVDPEMVKRYGVMATGEKALVTPQA